MIFGTIVKVVAGFYLGCTGTIMGVEGPVSHNHVWYSVYLSCVDKKDTSFTFTKTIMDSNLQVLK